MKQRVAVFIDNSNVFKRLQELYKIDKNWVKSYNPLILAQKVTGSNRDLIGVYFYCAPPPAHLQLEGKKDSSSKYWKQINYYESVKKLPQVEVKYAYLTGNKDNIQEKNLDTQLLTDTYKLANEDKYDTAILVCGDGDYLSGISYLKELNKKVELLYFKGKASMVLKRECDLSRRARISYFVHI